MVGGLLTGGALPGFLIGIAAASIQHGNLLQGGIAGAFLGGAGGGALGGLVAFAPNSVQRVIVQAGQAVLSVAAIVIGAMLIASGIGAPAGGWLIAQGVLTIASGCLSLGSQGAGLAGDYQLSKSLGYAAMGTAVAAIGCGFVEELGSKSSGDAGVKIEETYTDNTPSQPTTTHGYEEFKQHYEKVVAEGKQIQATIIRAEGDPDGPMMLGKKQFLYTSSSDDSPGVQSGLKTFGQMKGTFQKAFAPNAKIQLEFCMSARSMQAGQSIAADFKNALPGANVYGYPAYTYGVQIGSFRKTLTWWRQIEVKP